MKRKPVWIASIMLFSIFILSTAITFSCKASEVRKTTVDDGEVVILLDTSSSMNHQDGEGLFIDAVRQAAYSLPFNYQVGLVAYNTDIQLMLPFGEAISQWDTQLDTITYSGYTNAGKALAQALDMFSERENVNRYVVILTDGEIDMPDGQQKEASQLLYEEMVREAEGKGIIIFIVASGSEWNDAEAHIFDGAEVTGGKIYWAGQSESISKIINEILYNNMNFPGSSVGAAAGDNGKLSVKLPAVGAEHVRIILTTEQGIERVNADYTAESGMVINGRNFAVIDIVRPSGSEIGISYKTTNASDVEAYMITEYTARIDTRITYRSEEYGVTGQLDTVGGLPAYSHFADIEIALADTKGQNNNLWDSTYYEGREIHFTINGIPQIGIIRRGIITCSVQIDGLEEAVLELDVSNFSEYFKIDQPAVITFSPPVDPVQESEPNYLPLWLILGLLLVALLVLLMIWIRKKRPSGVYVMQEATAGVVPKKQELKRNSYTGKLNIYVIQTRLEEDIPPQTYRLFGRPNVQVTLGQVLNSCGIKLGRIGAEDICFYPGQDKALVVVDQSEGCTVLRGTEILKKGAGYPVSYNGKLTIIFEDGVTEMELYYKSLKPSELHNI